jgi:hypothetical protein
LGKLDNTLIIYIDGDNGTSPEGTLLGTPNQYTSYNGILQFPVAEQLKFYDEATLRSTVAAQCSDLLGRFIYALSNHHSLHGTSLLWI